MEEETKQNLIVAITIIIITSICVTCFYYNQNNKREKIESCIQQTGNELECKCTYRECYDKEREIILKKLELNK